MRISRLIVVFSILTLLAGCGEEDQKDRVSSLTKDQAITELDKLVSQLDVQQAIPTVSKILPTRGSGRIADSLPSIDEYPLTVDPYNPGGVQVEICSSSEKAGKGVDGWINEIAKDFNDTNYKTAAGTRGTIAIRKVASGTCEQYIASGKYRPQGFTPSNVLWIKMLSSRGLTMTEIQPRLVGNTAGIVMREETAHKINTNLGQVNLETVVESVAAGDIAMGYTNPYASSTGLNFLQGVLQKYAAGDPDRILDSDVKSAFVSFQTGVPFVALTTIQMRTAVADKGKRGSLDAFVMERQTFNKLADQASKEWTGWQFTPFGVRHDNPLYAVGDLTPDQMELLVDFGKFATNSEAKRKATEYGFNDPQDEQYQYQHQAPPGEKLLAAQQLWKQEKDSGRPVIGVFVVDTSGSMAGRPMEQVKQALVKGAEFISPNNAIGLVAFSDDPWVLAEIKPFDTSQRTRFLLAVDHLDDGGGTAMYRGLATAMQMAIDAKQTLPGMEQARIRIFVLSDGETNTGLGFRDIRDIIQSIGIPIYTIAYGGGSPSKELKRLSGLVEAASLNANSEKIEHLISSLLNAQM